MAYEVLQYPVYTPAMREIIAITNGFPALVTTGTITYPNNIPTTAPMAHGYFDGAFIHLSIPKGFGMPEANGALVGITIVNATQFLINLDTTLYTPFAIPPVYYRVSPVTLYDIALPPYKLIDDGTANGALTLTQFAQAIPSAEQANTLQSAEFNVLPYP